MNYISSGGQIIPNLLGNPRANHQPGSKDTPFCRSSSKLLRCFPRTKLQRTKPLFIIIYHLVRACFIGNCPEKNGAHLQVPNVCTFAELPAAMQTRWCSALGPEAKYRWVPKGSGKKGFATKKQQLWSEQNEDKPWYNHDITMINHDKPWYNHDMTMV